MSPNEDLKDEILAKLTVKMLTAGLPQSQCDLVTACFYDCTAGITFTRTSKELALNDPLNNAYLVKKFAANKMLEGLSPRTIKIYTQELQNLGQHISLLRASPDDIRAYLARYRLRGASNRTADNARRFLSSFYAWLTAEDYITKNPMLRVKRIKWGKTLREPFTEVEMERLRAGLTISPEDCYQAVKRQGYIVLHEPSCGGGSTILAACQQLRELGYNPQTQVLVKASDLDISCVHMAFAQLGLWGIPAVVKHQNALTGETFADYKTPFITRLERR